MEANIRTITTVWWFLPKAYSNIKILKSASRKIVGSAKPNFEELHTVLAQIENMTNTRPFTYLSKKNCDEHITPSHLMFGQNINRRSILNTLNILNMH